MAQTPQSEAPGGAGETAAPGAGRPPGLFGSSTTILLLIFAVAVFWWNRRRRVEIEERLRAQRREADAAAQRSALDVAHLMRGGSRPAAAAVVDEGMLPRGLYHPQMLYSRPPMPRPTPGRTQHDAAESGQAPHQRSSRGGSAEVERAEARAAAERAAEEQAERARRAADLAGESAMRRAVAASAAAEGRGHSGRRARRSNRHCSGGRYPR